MNSAERFQKQLLAVAQEIYAKTPLSEKTCAAFMAVPRHCFVKKYRRWRNELWITITPENLEEHLSEIYADAPLILHGRDSDFDQGDGRVAVSTISQPSFVLRMLDLLGIEPGQKVFELGTGSGWNAGLLGYLVGPKGKVVTMEIIPDLVESARASLRDLGLTQVEVKTGDGGFGDDTHAPYDRAIFTAGAYDLPRNFYSQVKTQGRFLFVLKNRGGTDTLLLLEKHKDHFESLSSMTCGFVPVTGRYHVTGGEAQPLEAYLAQLELDANPIDTQAYFWAGAREENFSMATAGIRSFLSVTEPLLVGVELESQRNTFGLCDPKSGSLVVARHNALVSYGSVVARDRLLADLKRWLDLGMPALSNLKVEIYPSNQYPEVHSAQWVVREGESTFYWSLRAGEKIPTKDSEDG